MPPTIAVVANEPSGDLLGAALLKELRRRRPELRFVGVAGPRMHEIGCETLVEMERLSVMGLAEVLAHLPELIGIRRRLIRHFLTHRPDVFVGVDAPDFNLGLERRLRSAGIRTVHLVCPTVWAWRPRRVKEIRRAVDLMLSLFPFEEAFLRQHDVPAQYVGHPMADEIPLAVDRDSARVALRLAPQGPLVALLPGSRRGEVQRLAGPFLEAAEWCLARHRDLRFATPLVNPAVRVQFEEIVRQKAPRLPLTLVDGRSREVMAASDVVLTASGTATLEALLLKRPMVVAYRVHPMSYHLVKGLKLVRVPHIAMSNLLAGEPLAPELIQGECRPERLGQALLDFLGDKGRIAKTQERYAQVHAELRRGAAGTAAASVLDLMGST